MSNEIDLVRVELSNTAISAERLAEIAYTHIELAPLIKSHPNAYPELIQWLEQYGPSTSSELIGEPSQTASDAPIAQSSTPVSSPVEASPAQQEDWPSFDSFLDFETEQRTGRHTQTPTNSLISENKTSPATTTQRPAPDVQRSKVNLSASSGRLDAEAKSINVLAIVAAVLCLTVFGVLFGLLARKQISTTKQRGSACALVGIIGGTLSTIIILVALFFYL